MVTEETVIIEDLGDGGSGDREGGGRTEEAHWVGGVAAVT